MAKRIIFWLSSILILIIGLTFIFMSFIKIDLRPSFSDPESLTVYVDGSQKGIAGARTDERYDNIVDKTYSGLKQNSFKALFKGTLNKDVKLNSFDTTQIVSFASGTWVIFEYDNEPQNIKDENGKQVETTFTYTNILFKVEYSDNYVYKIVFYLGSFSGASFSYNYSFTTYGNLNNLNSYLNSVLS